MRLERVAYATIGELLFLGDEIGADGELILNCERVGEVGRFDVKVAHAQRCDSDR